MAQYTILIPAQFAIECEMPKTLKLTKLNFMQINLHVDPITQINITNFIRILKKQGNILFRI